jgi:hypothetical protein
MTYVTPERAPLGYQMLNGYPTPSEPRRVSYVLRPNAPVADDGFASSGQGADRGRRV